MNESDLAVRLLVFVKVQLDDRCLLKPVVGSVAGRFLLGWNGKMLYESTAPTVGLQVLCLSDPCIN
jgi:hypothetical protein